MWKFKKLTVAAFFAAVLSLPAFSFDYGINFNAGLDASLINIYPYENITFKIEADNSVGVEAGVRLLENFGFVPHFYANPYIQFDAGHWYLGGGLMFPTDWSPDDELLWFVRTGFLFGNWDIGRGKGNIDLGLELSPTVYIVDDAEDQLGSAIGSVFLTLFNIFKVNLGFSWYLPFGGSH